jgi:PKD repeat protein
MSILRAYKLIYTILNMKNILLVFFTLCYSFAFSQTVTTYAGKVNDDPLNKYDLANGTALLSTYFSQPEGLCFDANGKMYVSERNKIRIVHNAKTYNRAGALSPPTSSEGYKNATGTQSTFRQPHGMVSDPDGNIYVADRDNHCIRKIAKFVNTGNGQVVSTFAGANPTTGLPGYGTTGTANGTGTAARFNQPTGIAIDANGNFYVTDYLNFTIRKITPQGVVSTIAGEAGVEGTSDGTGSSAHFAGPWGIAMLDASHVVVTDQYNTNIRKVNINTGVTTTIAGKFGDNFIIDGALTTARFKVPKGVEVVNGIIYVGDENTIRAIDIANNSVTTFAGDKSSVSVQDGNGSTASFTQISDITTDGSGNLYVSENSGIVASSVIRKVSINSLIPAANFSAPKRNVIIDEKITLTDISGGQDATSRLWAIDKAFDNHTGDLTSETLEVSFGSTGFYEVSLTITNDYGTDNKTVEAYFSVSTTGSVSSYNASDLVNVYPNPATSQVRLDLDGSLRNPHTSVKMFGINGQLIKDLTGLEHLDVSGIPNGTYYITVVNNDVSFAQKLIIAH